MLILTRFVSTLFNARQETYNAVLRASQEKVNILQHELRLYREQLFWSISYDSALFYGMASRVKTPIYSTP